MKPKIFAMYLPQFHQIPENDEFWGEGFTDWVAVKKAKPLYKGHEQPRVPLNDNYYDLSKEDDVEWQANLAYDNGIYGFGVYHYWFNNDKNLLTKPAEILRDSKKIKIKYFLSWDNGNWIRSWSNVSGNAWAPIAEKREGKKKGPQILIPYILGEEQDWRNHYNYVREHFLSKNYEKYKNKPLFSIINCSCDILRMCECWNNWAKEDGFDGIHFIFQNVPQEHLPKDSFLYNYEPHYVGWMSPSFMDKVKDIPNRIIRKVFRIMGVNKKRGVKFFDYDDVWKQLIDFVSVNDQNNVIQGSFVSYDDSPRRGKNGSKIIKGASPEKFKKYFSIFYDIMIKQNKPYVVITAWNEWGEGAYLEPDTKNEYKYLKVLREILMFSKNSN